MYRKLVKDRNKKINFIKIKSDFQLKMFIATKGRIFFILLLIYSARACLEPT